MQAAAGKHIDDVDQIKTDVGQLKTDVGQLKTDVGQLKTDVGQLKTDVDKLTALPAICLNLQLLWSNERNMRAGRALTPLLKSVPGHPNVVPANDVLAGLPVPVPLGSALPDFLPGGTWSHASVMSLTHAQLNDLQWFYNQQCGSGQSIVERQESFLRFLGCH